MSFMDFVKDLKFNEFEIDFLKDNAIKFKKLLDLIADKSIWINNYYDLEKENKLK